MGLGKFVWMDGKFVKWKDARIHIMTHSLHYGSAVFEGIHSYKTGGGTAIFRLDDHIERLFSSVNAMSMKLSLTKKQLKGAIIKAARINKIGDGYIRPLVYYGYSSIGVYPKGVSTNVAIAAIPWGHFYSGSLSIMTSSFRRNSERSSVYGAKISGNYANSVLAMYEARKKGFDEALMLDLHGNVSEGPAENIFIVKNNEIVSPLSRSALPGITRDSVLKISRGLGLKACEKRVKPGEARAANELFFCGTGTGIAPITSIDGKRVGNGKPGKITLGIKQKYDDIVRGKDKKYRKWLSFI
ncbi:branched-chain amino acid transaminase [Candidatus Woesearchaeota archaeon]|nr:branched-chain amino acid transaminase [Candidatus Woesearchaeota archaeon]